MPTTPGSEGEELWDLLEPFKPTEEEAEAMASVAAGATPGAPPRATSKKKRTVLGDEEREALFQAWEERMSAKRDARKPQVRVAPPPLFSGKRGSFAFFVSKVESYAKLTQVPRSKWVALGVQHLDEKPYKVWDAYCKKATREGKEEELTWDAFKSFMEKRYDSSDLVTIARQKLDKVYQGHEGVERYIERFVCLLSDIEVEYEMQEQDKIHLFLKGLNTPLRLACTVNPASGKAFSDLDDLCTYVVKYEAGLKTVPGDSQGREPKRARTYTHHPQLGALAGPVFASSEEQVTQSPYPQWGAALAVGGGFGRGKKIDSRTAIPSDRECYFCHKLGHEAWQCLAKKAWVAAKAKAAGHTPAHFQPGYYPAQGQGPPVAAPIQGVAPIFEGLGQQGGGKGKGKKGKKGKGKGAKPVQFAPGA